MNNITSRSNVILANTLSVLAICTGLLFLSTFHVKVAPDFEIEINQAQVRNAPDHLSGKRDFLDLSLMDYNLRVDMSRSFHWNVKMIFLYFVAEYTNKDNAINQVVLWDKIVMRGDNKIVELENAASKYFFFDDGNHLRGRNVTYSLHWNVIPNAGLLPNIRGSRHVSNVLPSHYTVRNY